MSEGQRLIELIHERNLSPAEFIEPIEGVDSSNISHWKRKNSLPSGEKLRAIWEVYPDFDFRYWFMGIRSGEGETATPTEIQQTHKELVYKIGELTLEKDEALKKQAEYLKELQTLLEQLEAMLEESSFEEKKNQLISKIRKAYRHLE